MSTHRSALTMGAAALALTLGLSGCGGSSVESSDVEKQISSELGKQIDQTIDSVDCPNDLKAEVGEEETCTLTADDATGARVLDDRALAGMVAGLEELVDAGAIAVGECGLDYHYDHSPRPIQREVFAAQVRLAHRRRLPLVIHTREAWADTFAILDEEGWPTSTVLHLSLIHI